jgi:hypothetical protein
MTGETTMLSSKNFSEETTLDQTLLTALTAEEAATINGGGWFGALVGGAVGGVVGWGLCVVAAPHTLGVPGAFLGAFYGSAYGDMIEDA